jgi:glutathione S-transferase kappa 1
MTKWLKAKTVSPELSPDTTVGWGGRYQRLLTAVRQIQPIHLEGVTAGVFKLIWGDKDARDAGGNVIITEAILQAICTSAGIPAIDAATCVAAIDSVETKSALKHSVVEAVERGAYGAPFIAVTGHGKTDQPDEIVVFGSDRFEQLAFVLGLPWYGPDPTRPSVGDAISKL